MIRSAFMFILACFLIGFSPSTESMAQDSEDPSLLVFTKTEGWRHASIPAGVEALKKIGTENGYTIDHTEDASRFNENNLADYDAVVFLNTTGDVLNETQQEAFENYIGSGGGYVGIHSASDTEYGWPWYGELVGAYFDGHPEIQRAFIWVGESDHPSTKGLPQEWLRTDEWYNFKNIQDHINTLAYLDEATYEGGTNGENHPIAWYHETMGGRAFYTGGGHTKESYSEPMFIKHITGGIHYVLGEVK